VPRVEYLLTPLGRGLAAVLDQIASLQARLDRAGQAVTPAKPTRRPRP
jgi:DNA-binding HxlR family transcriptional regulator